MQSRKKSPSPTFSYVGDTGFRFHRDPYWPTRLLLAWLTCVSLAASTQLAWIATRGKMLSFLETDHQEIAAQILPLSTLVSVIAAFLAYLFWLHRTCVNTRFFRPNGAKISPAWAVWQHFVPLLHLVLPLLTLCKVMRISRNPHRWQNKRAGFLVPFWWLVVLVTLFLCFVQPRDANDARLLSLTIYSGTIFAALLLVWIVRKIIDNQVHLVTRGAGRG